MIKRYLPAGVTLLALATCASAPNTTYYGRGICEPHGIMSPDGACRAQYRQQWSSADVYMQVIVSCKVDDNSLHGAVLIGYDGHAEHGVMLRWLSNDRLEVVSQAGAADRRPEKMSWFSDTRIEVDGRPVVDLGEPMAETSLVRAVHVTYRDLTPKDREWRRGCYLKRPKAKKS